MRRAARLATRAYREKTGEFLVEGPLTVGEAMAEPGRVVEVFATEQALTTHSELVSAAGTGGVPINVVDDDVIEAISDTVTPQGVVARAKQVSTRITDLTVQSINLALVAVDVRDPGNAGSLARVADAAGADALVLAGDCVDMHNPKSVRASAGSIFHLPIVVEHHIDTVLETLRHNGLRILAAEGTGDISLFSQELDLSQPTAWVVGNEAHGLARSGEAISGLSVRVPIFGQAESLNLAAAAAICLYASAKERR